MDEPVEPPVPALPTATSHPIVRIRYEAGRASDASGAALISAARARAGLSQAELAARSGIAQTVISAYERGRRQPSAAALIDLVTAAGLTIELAEPGRTPFTGPVGRKLEAVRDEVRELLTSRGYGNPPVFGSVARGDDTESSDVDPLVDVPQGVGLFALVGMSRVLAETIGAETDLVPREGLKPRVDGNIEGDLVRL